MITLTCSLAAFSSAILLGIAAGGGPKKDDPGSKFHEASALNLVRMMRYILPSKPPPPVPKSYPAAKRIELPSVKGPGESLYKSISRRRSVRNYSNEELTLVELSQLCWAASGVSGRIGGYRLRTAPSAGALYPLELYLMVNRVNSVPRGIYHYHPHDHVLEEVRLGDFSGSLTRAALGQDMTGGSAVTFIISSIFSRITSKYDVRGYRYAYIEAGHVSQNIYLTATALGLGSVAIGAFFDEKVNDILEIDGIEESSLYLHPVGRLRE